MSQTLVRLKWALTKSDSYRGVRQMQRSPDEVALQPPTERDYQELGGPLGAGRVFQEDQARHRTAEIPGKTHDLDQSRGKGGQVRERRYAPRRFYKDKRCIIGGC